MLLIDEVHTVAGLVGGATMCSFDTVHLLGQLCQQTPRVVMCDAHLMFTLNETEDTSASIDFAALLLGDSRGAVCATLPHLLLAGRVLVDDSSVRDVNVSAKQLHHQRHGGGACCGQLGDRGLQEHPIAAVLVVPGEGAALAAVVVEVHQPVRGRYSCSDLSGA